MTAAAGLHPWMGLPAEDPQGEQPCRDRFMSHVDPMTRALGVWALMGGSLFGYIA
jgi:hypothetical protein